MGETTAALILGASLGFMAGLAIGMHLREYLLVRLRGWEWQNVNGRAFIIAHRPMDAQTMGRLKAQIDEALTVRQEIRLNRQARRARG